MSRRPLWQRQVSYAAVGATKAADLMSYPPAGYRPFERRARIGHGELRWDYASRQILSWGIQRKSGFRVRVEDAPAEVTDHTYTPVSFADDGTPIGSATLGAADEPLFGSDGTPFVAPGDTAVLGIPLGPFRVRAPARVVYVVDEPKRKGFAYGTIAGHPESGEESFIVYLREDGSVWLEIRSFSRPAHALWWCVYPVLRASQRYYTNRYFRVLAGAIQ